MAKKDSSAAIRQRYEEVAAEFNKKYKELEKAAPKARILEHFDPYEFQPIDIRKIQKKPINMKALKLATRKMQMTLDDNALSIEAEDRRVDSAINRLHQMGFDWINKDNIHEFFAVMEKLRALKLDKTFGSKFAAGVLKTFGTEEVMAKVEAAAGKMSSESMMKNFQRIISNMEKGKEYKRLYFRNYK